MDSFEIGGRERKNKGKR
uniref:Uncharacterized protein n=1 Tax=Arundo donax TaxID=35708 RepID=A0A0A8ZI30_ARUDO